MSLPRGKVSILSNSASTLQFLSFDVFAFQKMLNLFQRLRWIIIVACRVMETAGWIARAATLVVSVMKEESQIWTSRRQNRFSDYQLYSTQTHYCRVRSEVETTRETVLVVTASYLFRFQLAFSCTTWWWVSGSSRNFWLPIF